MSCERARFAALLGLAGCYTQVAGLGVDVVVAPSDADVAFVQERRSVTNDLGFAMVIRHGWIAVTHVELERCPAGSQARSWLPSLEASADASEGLADDMDAGVVPLGVRGGEPMTLGTLRPSPGSFCAVTVQYGPVGSLDDTGVPDGTWTLDLDLGDDAPRPLHDASRHLATAELEPPLELDAHHRHATLAIALPVARWFDGLRPTRSDDDMLATINRDLASPPLVELR